VNFRINAVIDELTTCDCSLCRRKNAIMAKVHESELTILSGEDLLSAYAWNTHRAKHFFCSRCGVYVFHRKRAAPDRKREAEAVQIL
jgi:CRISPR-associated protein Cas8b1/Cst1 subtype I-B